MRVIAGDARGRKLSAPRGLATRPTLARVRESMFSRLSVRLDFQGLRVLDLFAGTGSLGIESLSRGAGHVTFVESARAALIALRRNLDALGFSGRARVLKSDVIRALEALAAAGEHFDLVLLDPPYRKGWGDKVLPRLMELNLLSDGGWVATEVSRLEVAPASLSGLERVSLATLGDHQIALYQRQSREAAL
ncbi:MAG TPA: 16S rRNA (guanine(966)-N(2))-methyltransferase RsmD [Candidatus Binataceae bacterium]|jgi:16S rRNA (guanine966-N2)-methyltransferase|nr:16S rRNA (guanine(966)-N(2))-methyltransferase RsmD [Candidatus Binataceae bacterium]